METLLFRTIMFFTLTSLEVDVVTGLMCYECDNKDSAACGHHFKSYQYIPVFCGNNSVKCAVQRQPPNDKDWIGIRRGCYQLGQLPGINETNGCRHWENVDGFTALYCFCDTDYCNGAPVQSLMPTMLFVAATTFFSAVTL